MQLTKHSSVRLFIFVLLKIFLHAKQIVLYITEITFLQLFTA